MSGVRVALVVVAAAVLFGAPGAVAHHRSFTGETLYYSDEYDGSAMACGGVYRPWKMVAAHRTLPCGKKLRVRNLANGKVVTVTVRDRGPFETAAKLDVSKRAARGLGFLRAGTARVKVRILHD